MSKQNKANAEWRTEMQNHNLADFMGYLMYIFDWLWDVVRTRNL